MATIKMGPRHDEIEFLNSSYIVRDRQLENERTKQVQRNRVIDHTIKNHCRDDMVMFSLPGMWWTFENQMDDAFSGKSSFVAIEKNYSIMQHGVTFMPGSIKNRYQEVLVNGTIDGHESEKSRILWCHGSTFFDIGRSDKRNKAHVKQWKKRYKSWTAAWLDFTSPLCMETLKCIRRVDQFIESSVDVCPISITILPAREPQGLSGIVSDIAGDIFDKNERRGVFIERWFNAVSVNFEASLCDVFPYKSEGGCPMMLATFLFERRTRHEK